MDVGSLNYAMNLYGFCDWAVIRDSWQWQVHYELRPEIIGFALMPKPRQWDCSGWLPPAFEPIF